MKRVIILLGLTHLFNLNYVTVKADMNLVAQSRSVSAENSTGVSESKSAPDFDVFDEEANVYWDNTDYSAASGQVSTISSNKISIWGIAEEWSPLSHFLVDPFTQSSSSNFYIEFVVETRGVFVLTGMLEAWGDYGGSNWEGEYYAEVGLISEAGNIFLASINGGQGYNDPSPIQINETFGLGVGSHLLYANASSYNYYSDDYPLGGGFASFDIQLIPEPTTLLLLGLGGLMLRRKR